MLGATNPLASAPGTIRGDYAIVWSLIPRTTNFVGRRT
jgi:nucleoside diphosphate kinase